jgi:tetratricopeptide (TPR) repeat protein
MYKLKLTATVLSLAIASLNTYRVNIPTVEASSFQRQETQTKANNWLSQGLKKANQQDYQGAESDFTQAIQINPQYAEAYYQRGLIYAKYAKGTPLKRDGTIPGCKKIDGYRIICELKITSNWKQENQEKAVADFTQAIDLYFQRSLTYLKENKYKKAAEILETMEQLYIEKESLNTSPEKEKASEAPRGSSTLSPELKKSISELMNEASEYLRKGDVQSALQKYREAAHICKEKKDTRCEEIEEIIRELEPKVS